MKVHNNMIRRIKRKIEKKIESVVSKYKYKELLDLRALFTGKEAYWILSMYDAIALDKIIKKYNLKNFTLTGRFQDARRYLKAFDVFVLPSVKEGFPWVVLEAMAAGVPIVATKVGAVPKVIENNKDGFIVRPRDADGLASSINTFLNDKTLAQNTAQNAYEKLKQFSKERMLQESYEALNV